MALLYKFALLVVFLWAVSTCEVYGNNPNFQKHSNDIDKVVIIKADDLRKPNAKWIRFMQIVKAKSIKASVGIIAHNFPHNESDAVKWVREHQNSGRIEFWNHGWDHKRWKDKSGTNISEFLSSGYKHQKQNLDKSQKKLSAILGRTMSTFGAPFNAMDANTVKALETMPELIAIFHYPKKKPIRSVWPDSKTMLYMHLVGENEGVGKPNFEKFKIKYENQRGNVRFTALQFHPSVFSEEGFQAFESIIDFLKQDGWTFMLPNEYISYISQ